MYIKYWGNYVHKWNSPKVCSVLSLPEFCTAYSTNYMSSFAIQGVIHNAVLTSNNNENSGCGLMKPITQGTYIGFISYMPLINL